MSYRFPGNDPPPQPRPKARDIVFTILSAMFVIAGLVVAALGGVWPGLCCAVFFGGCVVVGIHELAPPDSPVGKVAAIVGCFLLSLGGFAFAIGVSKPFSETQMSGGWRGDTTVIFVGIFCGLFFCLGAVAIAARMVVDARRIKRQQQWYDRHM